MESFLNACLCFFRDADPLVAAAGAALLFVVQWFFRTDRNKFSFAALIDFVKGFLSKRQKPSDPTGPLNKEDSKSETPALDEILKDRPILRNLRDVLAEILRRKFAERALTAEIVNGESDDEKAVKDFVAVLNALRNEK